MNSKPIFKSKIINQHLNVNSVVPIINRFYDDPKITRDQMNSNNFYENLRLHYNRIILRNIFRNFTLKTLAEKADYEEPLRFNNG